MRCKFMKMALAFTLACCTKARFHTCIKLVSTLSIRYVNFKNNAYTPKSVFRTVLNLHHTNISRLLSKQEYMTPNWCSAALSIKYTIARSLSFTARIAYGSTVTPCPSAAHEFKIRCIYANIMDRHDATRIHQINSSLCIKKSIHKRAARS